MYGAVQLAYLYHCGHNCTNTQFVTCWCNIQGVIYIWHYVKKLLHGAVNPLILRHYKRSQYYEINHDNRVRTRCLSALLATLRHIQGASARLLRLAGDGMSRTTGEIIAKRDAGLISAHEARDALKALAKRARFNANYSDSPASYKRWDRIALNALGARWEIS